MNLRRTLLVFLFLTTVIILAFGAIGAELMTVRVNVIADEIASPTVSIEVPDDVFLGNVSKSQKSEEARVWVNNTGSVAVNVTPELVDSSNEIFQNLYMRGQKTKTINGTVTDVPFERIGYFSFTISKPSSRPYEDEDFYMVLDLTNYAREIPENLIDYQTDVKFIATAI